MRARAVTWPVCSQAQMVNAKLVMLVPRRLTNWPAHMTVKPVMPLSLVVMLCNSF